MAAYEQNDATAAALVKRAAELLTETVGRVRTTSDKGPMVLAGSVAGESSPVGRLIRVHFAGEVLGALDPSLATRENHTRLVSRGRVEH